RISTSSLDSVVFIEVQDDGCGISTTKLAALRESIGSREFSPSDGGGLGLAIASKVIADHAGTFTVDSVLRTGTRCDHANSRLRHRSTTQENRSRLPSSGIHPHGTWRRI